MLPNSLKFFENLLVRTEGSISKLSENKVLDMQFFCYEKDPHAPWWAYFSTTFSIVVQRWLSLRQIHILFSNVLSVILHSLLRNYFTKKIRYFTSISSVVTSIPITVTNISNSIIKQYYDIIKMFKVLVIVKKKQFSITSILIVI